jgi:SPP1 gp7 family putative phage head morphogenesis protein
VVYLELPVLGFSKVKPEGAIRFVVALKAFRFSAWRRLKSAQRLWIFTLPGVEDLALILRTRDILAQALDEGWTREMFIKKMDQEFDAGGVPRLDPYKADIVFGQNMSTAYSYGHLKQMSDSDVAAALPFWRFRTMEDAEVRPNHAALNRFIAKATDPIWHTIYPPIGKGCRCCIEPLLRSEGEIILGDKVNVPGLDRLPAGARPDRGFQSIGILLAKW